MSEKSTFRVMRELRQVESDPDHQFYISFNEIDVTNINALIVGPPTTPYAFGMFNFNFTFPPNYPTSPPIVTCSTTNNGNTRFNPNIYSNGKVCLSLLGTWAGESIEQWNSAHGILSVLISIQSLMCEKPFHNEPGYEHDKTGSHSSLIADYNRKIIHETIRISVCDRLESYFNTSISKVCPFQETCKFLFACYYYRYLDIIERELPHVEKSEMFASMPFESFKNTMSGRFDYVKLQSRLHTLYATYFEEFETWTRQSVIWTETHVITRALVMQKYEEIQSKKYFDGSLVIVLRDSNPFVWYITAFGQPATSYEAGIFQIEMVFHYSFPETRPRLKFVTPFFHPNVSQDGIVYHRVSRADDIKSQLDAILFLFTKDPHNDPVTHLNKSAAELFFGPPEKRREYSFRARKCAANSLE